MVVPAARSVVDGRSRRQVTVTPTGRLISTALTGSAPLRVRPRCAWARDVVKGAAESRRAVGAFAAAAAHDNGGPLAAVTGQLRFEIERQRVSHRLAGGR